MDFQNSATLFFLLSLGLSLILSPVFIRFAPQMRMLDRPGGRKIHQAPIPRVGGLALTFSISISVVVGLTLFRFLHLPEDQTLKLIIILAGAVAAAFLGYVDDLIDLRPLAKFGCQVLLAGGFAIWGYHFSFFNIPGFPAMPLSIFCIPFTTLWFMAVIKGFNFWDGGDGLA